MNELIKIKTNSEDITLSARELHGFLEINSNFTTWFKRMCEYGFTEQIDFIPILEESIGGRPGTDFEIKLDMAKEIAMIQRNEKGKQARQYFIQVEKYWNSPEMIMKRALEIANNKVETLRLQISDMKPKADFYEAVAGSKDSIEMSHVAKVLGLKNIGRNKLFEILRDKKILDKSNIPYQKYVDQGYFRVLEQKYTIPTGETKINIKTMVFQKGVDFIRRTIGDEKD